MNQSDNSLHQIMRGAIIALFGIFSGLVLQFGARVLIARYFGEDNYGLFSLAIAVLNLLIVFATLGFQDSIPRYIAHFHSKNENHNVNQSIKICIYLSGIISIFFAILLYAFAEVIAGQLFHLQELASPLRILAIALPFLASINIFTAIFRGFGDTAPHALFQLFCINLIFILLLLLVQILNLPFIFILYAYLCAIFISFIGLLIFFIKNVSQNTGNQSAGIDHKLTVGIIKFSIPLMGTILLSALMTWSDTMFLGYFTSTEEVGLYNAASPIAQFIFHPLSAWLLIYIPVATALYANKDIAALKRNYVIVTKWIISSTIPLYLVILFFPEAVINLFFGPSYIKSATPLRILATGFIINNLFGLRGVTLIALGDSRFIFWANLIATAACVILNIILIPLYGIPV